VTNPRDIGVVGGCYLDTEILLEGPLMRERSIAIRSTGEHFGGPGYCYAARLSENGWNVALDAVVGDDRLSDDLMADLALRGVIFVGTRQVGTLDRATVLTEPDGSKVTVSAKALSRTLPSRPPPTATPVVVASPTDLRRMAKLMPELGSPRRDLFLAPHTLQIEQLSCMGDSELAALAARTAAVSVNEAECPRDLLDRFDEATVMFATAGARGGMYRENGVWRMYPPGFAPFSCPRVNGAGEAFFAGALTALSVGSDAGTAAGEGALAAVRYLQKLNQCADVRVAGVSAAR
jgi:sugar/nucleoside kinase (ribokinase family)